MFIASEGHIPFRHPLSKQRRPVKYYQLYENNSLHVSISHSNKNCWAYYFNAIFDFSHADNVLQDNQSFLSKQFFTLKNKTIFVKLVLLS